MIENPLCMEEADTKRKGKVQKTATCWSESAKFRAEQTGNLTMMMMNQAVGYSVQIV